MKEAIEAILFSSPEPISAEKIAKIIGAEKKAVEEEIERLIEEYSSRKTALEIIKLGRRYLMRVKPEFSRYVEEYIEKDLPKGVLRTLAVIALRQPIKLSELAKIRGNKCYEHVKKLKELGFVNVEKKGKNTILTTTKLFADYFGLKSADPEEIRKTLSKYVKRDAKLEDFL